MRSTTKPNASRDGELRRILETQRHRILEDLRATVRAVRAQDAVDAGEVQDEAERSEADIQSDLEFSLMQMRSETLAQIEEALKRLDSGEFGRCSECKSEIPAARLRAMPFAIRCRACEQERETLGGIHRPRTTWQLPL